MISLGYRHIALTGLLLATPVVSSAQLLEDFNAPGAAWESGWLGLNSDLGNYYCGGARGCANRGNAPTALWAWGPGSITVNFDPTFGATISYFSLDIGNFTGTNLLIYDMSNSVIFNQAVAYNPVFSDGTTYSVFSSNGVSRFYFDGDNSSGNVNLDNVRVDVNVSAVPEPASMMLLGTGLVGVFGVARRVRRNGVKLAA